MFITIKTADGQIKLPASNRTLLETLRDYSYNVASPCGGNGTCGKCQVEILSDAKNLPAITASESVFNLPGNIRLACYLPSVSGLVVDISKFRENDAVIQTDFVSLSDEGLLPSIEIKNDGSYYKSQKLSCTKTPLAVAIDVGTTTLAAYLVDLNTGDVIDVKSMLNPQRDFGLDVISRSSYIAKHSDGLKTLQKAILFATKKLCTQLLYSANREDCELNHILFCGNTIMMHILAGANVDSITVAPFLPKYTTGFTYMPYQLSYIDYPAVISFLPCLAGYIGADTLACLIATGIPESDELYLLLDMGTNGEIALGSKKRIITCATAAGPAFEGGHISFGMGGVSGAISKVWLTDSGIQFSVIGNSSPKGICGSGIFDLISILINLGFVSESGYMELCGDERIDSLMCEYNSQPALLLYESKDDRASNIYLTQQDIREIQLAKAAIAAGIEILLDEYSRSINDVEKVFIAGGFGSHLSIQNAIAVGLLPKEIKNRTISAGNAAGKGVVMCAKNKHLLGKIEILRENTEYIELSSNKKFNEHYVEQLLF